MIEDMINRNLLLKYISGKASYGEKIEVLDWIDECEENRELFCELKNLWVADQLNRIEEESNLNIYRKSLLKKVLKIASIIVFLLSLPISGYLLYQSQRSQLLISDQQPVVFKYIVNTGVKGVVDLPDGSRVWLNSASYIICPQKFADDKRELEIEGEGYFEVVSNKDWPMIIKTTKNHSVKVTGTTFNLSSYSNDNKLVLTLITGEVSLINDKENSEIKLTPSQEVVIIDEKSSELLKNPNIINKTAWKDGLLLFDNTPMVDVIKRMERWYGVNFQIKDTLIYDYRFTAKFRSESISQVLEILRLSSNIKYQIDSTTITLAKK